MNIAESLKEYGIACIEFLETPIGILDLLLIAIVIILWDDSREDTEDE